jgi:uncharacterized protein YecT (DUF1311 family)
MCDSPAPADQRRCLSSAIDRKDAALNDLYQRVVRALRRQANVQPEDADPPSVDDLRNEQRAWTEDRDTLCQTVGSGALYARERAACYSDRTDRRMRALQAKLDALPPG